MQCAPLPLVAPDEVHVEKLQAIEPTWSKALPITDSAREHGGDWSLVQLSSDREGHLWLFDRVDAGVRVSTMSDEGKLLDSTVVSPPAGSTTPLVSLAVNAAWETGRDPASKLVWSRGPGCDQTVDRTPGCASDYEKLIFDRGIDQAPLRVTLVENLMSDGFVSERGELFYTPVNSVTKLDRDTRSIVWQASDFNTVSTDFDLVGVALADGRVGVLRHSAAAFWNSVVFHWLDANGGGGADPDVLVGEADRSSYRLLATGNQPVVVHTDDLGDLHVQRVSQPIENTQITRFLREDYHFHDLRASAIAPSGDVYVVTSSGRRDAGKPTLCRAAVEGASSCVTLPETYWSNREEYSKLENLVARDGGVVFVQYGTQFLRFDYPLR